MTTPPRLPRRTAKGTGSADWPARKPSAPDPTTISVELHARTGLDEHLPAWRALIADALEPNIFFEPELLLPALATLADDEVRILLAWRNADPASPATDTGPTRRLVGLFPIIRRTGRYGPFPAPASVWRNVYSVLGTPLLARRSAVPALAAMFRFLAHCPSTPPLLLIPCLRNAGPVTTAIGAASATAGRRATITRQWHRAELRPGPDRATYLERALGARRRRTLARYHRRLAERGELQVTTADLPETIMPALDEFLALESSGWKGRAGTAIATNPADTRFFTEAVKGLAARRDCRIDALRLNGRPIAMLVSIFSAGILYPWKIAFDEAHANRSPGVLLLVEFTRDILSRPTPETADSLTEAGNSLIEPIWRERLEMVDIMVDLGANPLRRHLTLRLEAWRETLRGAVNRWRARRGGARKPRKPRSAALP